jgi:hypothetical protein
VSRNGLIDDMMIAAVLSESATGCNLCPGLCWNWDQGPVYMNDEGPARVARGKTWMKEASDGESKAAHWHNARNAQPSFDCIRNPPLVTDIQRDDYQREQVYV